MAGSLGSGWMPFVNGYDGAEPIVGDMSCQVTSGGRAPPFVDLVYRWGLDYCRWGIEWCDHQQRRLSKAA